MTVSVATHQSYIIRSLPCTLQNCLAYIISILRIFPLLLAPLHVLLSVQFQLDAQVLAVFILQSQVNWTNLGKHFVLRLVMRLRYNYGHKTYYASRRTSPS